jgi:hypothetical protein
MWCKPPDNRNNDDAGTYCRTVAGGFNAAAGRSDAKIWLRLRWIVDTARLLVTYPAATSDQPRRQN